MYLKSLKLTGFKSFADRTRLEFRPGVTVVVGPNGSGKSNLVDALSWVLGTQSAKSLRTPKMEDVIFAGTTSRPALGRAEVTLVIDNTDRLIDLDLEEVAITRRLYRDGSSDYELNGVGCRLLDIQDLLSDSGVGRHQHVIIGQGEIGQVLNASPAEHREVIEEAAGILKHRKRKERAERRLERTDEDLLRLADIVNEITRQMRPLRRQARAAERYDGVKAEVIALRLYLSGQSLLVQDRELTVATSERSSLVESLEIDQRRVENLEKDLTRLASEASRLASELDRDTNAAALLETTSERLRRVASVAHERRRAASGRIEVAAERTIDLTGEAAEIDTELAEIAATREGIANDVRIAELHLASVEEEERAIATQTSLTPEGAQAVVRGELSGVEATLNRDHREIGSIDHRLQVLRSQITEETAAVDAINDEVQALDSQLTSLQIDYEKSAAERSADQNRWSAAETALAEARIGVASMSARVEAISSAMDGRYDPETRRLVESSSGAVGTLISRLDVPEGLESAVGAALGGWVDALAFIDREALRDAMARVKASGGGSVTVVSPGNTPAGSARRLAGVLGLEALVDLLGSGADRNLAESMLGDVVMTHGWLSAWEVVATHPEVRAVTPEGDLVTADGVTIANADGAVPVMLELAEVALERAITDEARAVSVHTAAKREFEASRERERNALEALEGVEATLAGRSEAMGRLGQSVAGLEAEIDRLETRRQELNMAVAAGERHASTLRARLDGLQGEEAELQRAWDELESRKVQLAAVREVARSAWQETVGRLRAVDERERLLADRRRRIDEEIVRLGVEPGTIVDAASLEKVEEVAGRGLKILEAGLAVLRERQAALRVENERTRTELTEVRDEHETRREAIHTARERMGELDVRLTELRLQREAVVEAIRRDADSDAEAAYVAPRPPYAEAEDLEAVLTSKLAELSRMGPINPLAGAEYRDLEERHSFLTAQVADVESSRAELRKVIAALDIEINERFQTAFTEVAAGFEKYFALLFPGGRGRIRLVDADDPESGLSIDAQPMGKKVSQMSLLSGGERSLAALALLFAIFEARPSPFYVLDEVEAALDDVNLRRFLKIVSEFRGRAQMIVITHQQQTMEVADVLYGITMETGGTSKALRKDMADVVEPAVEQAV